MLVEAPINIDWLSDIELVDVKHNLLISMDLMRNVYVDSSSSRDSGTKVYKQPYIKQAHFEVHALAPNHLPKPTSKNKNKILANYEKYYFTDDNNNLITNANKAYKDDVFTTLDLDYEMNYKMDTVYTGVATLDTRNNHIYYSFRNQKANQCHFVKLDKNLLRKAYKYSLVMLKDFYSSSSFKRIAKSVKHIHNAQKAKDKQDIKYALSNGLPL